MFHGVWVKFISSRYPILTVLCLALIKTCQIIINEKYGPVAPSENKQKKENVHYHPLPKGRYM